MVIYTDKFLPDDSAGGVRLWFILIRPKYRNDIGLHKHEQVHVDQFWRLPPLLHPLLYTFSKTYRLKCEVEAYREQLRWCETDRTEKFAWFIANKYELDIDIDAARALLAGAWEHPI